MHFNIRVLFWLVSLFPAMLFATDVPFTQVQLKQWQEDVVLEPKQVLVEIEAQLSLALTPEQTLMLQLLQLKALIADDYNFSMLEVLSKVQENDDLVVNKAIKVEALLLEAQIKQYFGAFSESFLLMDQALAIADTLDDTSLIVQVYTSFGQLHLALDQNELAQQFYDKASSLVPNYDAQLHGRILIFKGQTLVQKGSYRQAFVLYQQAALLLAPDSINQIYLHLAIAEVSLHLGQANKAIFSLDYISSHFSLDHAVELKLKHQSLLARSFLQLGQFTQAITLAKAQLAVTYNSRFLSEQAQLQQLLSTAYLQMGLMGEAYLYLSRSHLTEIALSEQTRNNKVLLLEAQLNTRLQQQQILLLEKSNQLNQSQLVQQQLLRDQQRKEHQLTQKVSVALSIFLVLTGWFFYRRYITRQYLKRLKAEVSRQTNELALINEQLKQLSYSDSLTGLHNRHYLMSLIDDEVALINRLYFKNSPSVNQDRDLVFAIIDIDHFKQVNDRFGHATGDLVLKQFAQIVKQIVREADYVVRWGGEEFLIVFRQVDRTQIHHVIERLRNKVAQHLFESGKGDTLQSSCSIGMAAYPFDVNDAAAFTWQQVLDIADLALYAAKKTQRNAWVDVQLAVGSSLSANTLFEQGLAQLHADKKISIGTNIKGPLLF